ncbi:LPS export ABC transporter periplasmic protein LptC [Fodinicurvata sp. EGI_FJ10296]|uniref:LPS export ABC transporter periplasmic protein LptC n=1 Tax=Fodinicurvata sp. EGI_FJ10296 TaxID=3231908 RepID=UPI00345304D4
MDAMHTGSGSGSDLRDAPGNSLEQRGRRAARFGPRRRDESRHRAHSRFVSLLRIVLPLLVLAIVSLIFLWPQLRDAGLPATTVSISTSGGDTTVLNPRYEGTDAGDQPYRITAAQATRPADSADRLDLQEPVAEMTLTSGRRVTIDSVSAVYNETTEDLVMRGDVELHRDDGYVFRTSEAHANVGEQVVWGDQPVTGSGPAGTIDAEGFRVEDSGNTIIFTGQSRLVLTNGRGERNQ